MRRPIARVWASRASSPGGRIVYARGRRVQALLVNLYHIESSRVNGTAGPMHRRPIWAFGRPTTLFISMHMLCSYVIVQCWWEFSPVRILIFLVSLASLKQIDDAVLFVLEFLHAVLFGSFRIWQEQWNTLQSALLCWSLLYFVTK
jgi:hypothetical protein